MSKPSLALDGHIFYVASEDLVQEELEARALETLGGANDLHNLTFEDSA